MADRFSPARAHGAGLVSFTVLGLVCLVGTFLPWLHTGSRTRSSYELFSIIDRLGFAPDGAIGILIRLWPVVPLLLTVAVLLHWWHRLLAGVIAAASAALYVGGVSIALVVGAQDRPIDLGVGPGVCTVATVAFLTNAVVLQVINARCRATRTPRGAPRVDRS